MAYLLMAVAVITLAPFRFVPSPTNAISLTWTTFDLVMNVAMFVPIGFIHQLTRPARARLAWSAVFLGMGISVAIESAQAFAPGRFPSPLDVATNTTGAVVGAWLAARSVPRVDVGRAVRASGVELPLMGLVYLLLPLAWLGGLGSDGGGRAWTLVPLSAAAGWIIGAVFTSFERAKLPRTLLAAAAWLTVALVPAAFVATGAAAGAALAGLAAAWMRGVAPPRITFERGTAEQPPRRFEAPTLHVALPLLLIYLTAASLTPGKPSGTWTGALTLLPPGVSPTTLVIFRALEHIGAFALAGYAIAEYKGRSLDRFGSVAPVALGWALVLSSGLQWARGWYPGYGASALLLTLTLIAAVLGARLYLLQLAHIRALTASARPA